MESGETVEDFLSSNSLLYENLENCNNASFNNSPGSEISNLEWHSILEQQVSIKSELVSPLLSPCSQPQPLSGVSSPLSRSPSDSEPQDEPPSLVSPATPVTSISGSTIGSAPAQTTADLFHKTLYQCQYCKCTFEPLAIVHHQITCSDLFWMRASSRCRQALPFRLHMEAEPVGTFRKTQLGQRRPTASKKRRCTAGVRRATATDPYAVEMSLPEEDSGSNSTNCTPVKGSRASEGCKSSNVGKCSVTNLPVTISEKSTKSSRRKRHEMRSARLTKTILPASVSSRVNNALLSEANSIVLEISPPGAGSDSGSDGRRRLLPPPPLTSEDDVCPEPIVTGAHALLPGQEDDMREILETVSDHHFQKKHGAKIDNSDAPPNKVARQMSPPNLENDGSVSKGHNNTLKSKIISLGSTKTSTDCLNHSRPPQVDSSMFVTTSSFQPLSVEANEYPVIHLPDRPFPSPKQQHSLFRHQQQQQVSSRSPAATSLSPVFTEDWQAQWPPTYKHLWRYIMSDREDLSCNVNVPEGFVANVLERYFHDEIDTAVRRLSPVGNCSSSMRTSSGGPLPMRLAETALQRYLERRQWLACRLGNPSLARTRFRSSNQLDPCYRGRRFGELLPPEYFLFPNTPAHEADEYAASGERVRLIGRPPYVHVAGPQHSQITEQTTLRGSSSSMECSPPFSERPIRKRSRGHNSGTKIVPIKDRVYNPDEHCGVCISKEDQRTGTNSTQHCLRSLTCKTHTLTQRRAVPGRTEDLNVLLDRNKMQRLMRSQRLANESANAMCKNEVGESLENSGLREQHRDGVKQQQHNKLRSVAQIMARKSLSHGVPPRSPDPPNLEHYPSLEQVEERFIHRGVLPDAQSGPQVDLCASSTPVISVSKHQIRSSNNTTSHPFAVDPQIILLHPPHPSTPDSTKSSKCSTDEAEEFGNGSGAHFSYPPSLPLPAAAASVFPHEVAPSSKRPTIVLKFNNCVAQSLCRRTADRNGFLLQRRKTLVRENEHRSQQPMTQQFNVSSAAAATTTASLQSPMEISSSSCSSSSATSLLVRRKASGTAGNNPTSSSLDHLQPYVQKVKCPPSASPTTIMPITSAVSLTSASALVNVSSSYNTKEMVKQRILQLAVNSGHAAGAQITQAVQQTGNLSQLQRRVAVRSVTVLPGGNNHTFPSSQNTYAAESSSAHYLNQRVAQQCRLRQPSTSVKDAKQLLMQQRQMTPISDTNSRMVRLPSVSHVDDNGSTMNDYSSALNGLRLQQDTSTVVKQHSSAQQLLLPKPTGAAYQFLSQMPSSSSTGSNFSRFSAGVPQMPFVQQRQPGYATANRPTL